MGIAPLREFDKEIEAQAYYQALVDYDIYAKERLFIFKEDNGKFSVSVD